MALGADHAGSTLRALHIVVEASRLSECQIEIVDSALLRSGEDVVVDIGDVADTASLVPQVAQTALQNVVGDVCGGVT